MQIDLIRPEPVRRGFSFFEKRGHVVSLVGGGGKTTLMFNIAAMAAENGRKVLVTTTTHIGKPKNGSYAAAVSDAQKLWQQKKYAVIGNVENHPEKHITKLTMPDDQILSYLMKEADLTLVEADGAKRCPCKMPRDQEPVFLPECDLVIAVVGLSAVGKPIQDVCFGLNEIQNFLHVDPEHILNEDDVAKMLSSEQGGRKDVGNRLYYVVLNQCDDDTRRKSGRKIAELLYEQGISNVVLTAFAPDERY